LSVTVSPTILDNMDRSDINYRSGQLPVRQQFGSWCGRARDAPAKKPVRDLAVIGNRSLLRSDNAEGGEEGRKSGGSDVCAGSSVTAACVIVERECRDYKTSSSSHLSKVETVLSKCLPEIICRRCRTPVGRLRTQSVLVELSDINPPGYRSVDPPCSPDSPSPIDSGRSVSSSRLVSGADTFAADVSFRFTSHSLSSR